MGFELIQIFCFGSVWTKYRIETRMITPIPNYANSSHLVHLVKLYMFNFRTELNLINLSSCVRNKIESVFFESDFIKKSKSGSRTPSKKETSSKNCTHKRFYCTPPTTRKNYSVLLYVNGLFGLQDCISRLNMWCV